MAQRRSGLKWAHRAHTVLTLLIVLALLVLNRTGVIGGGVAMRLFLMIELPLLVVFVTISVLRFRHLGRENGTSEAGLLDRLVAEEPLLRPVVAEFRTFGSLVMAVRGKRKVPRKPRGSDTPKER